MDGGAPGEICTNQGRCEAECRSDLDCPAGAFCADSCGVCFTKTLTFATCFVGTLPQAEVLGACRASDLEAGQRRAAASPLQPPEVVCAAGRPGSPLPFPDGFFPPDATDAVADREAGDVSDGSDIGDASDVADADASGDREEANTGDAGSDARDGESSDVDP